MSVEKNHTDRTVNERLAVLEEILLRVELRLFGNGQPGEIERLRTKMDEAETSLDSRLVAIESGMKDCPLLNDSNCAVMPASAQPIAPRRSPQLFVGIGIGVLAVIHFASWLYDKAGWLWALVRRPG